MFMVYDVINLGLAFRADEDGSGPGRTAAAVLNDISNLALGLGGTMFAAVFVACTALERAGHRCPAALALLTSASRSPSACSIAPISWAFLPILLLWVLAVERRDVDGAGPRRPQRPA